MSKNKAKKHPESGSDGENGSAAIEERPRALEPFGWMGDWFDQWPPVFGRRLPEIFERGLGSVEGMRVEEFEDGAETVIRAEIPGVDPDEDIDISVDGGRLTISAKRERRETDTENGYRSEFHYGSFRRSMTLPSGVSADDVIATYVDGILEIRLPIDGEEKAKTKVPITHTPKSN